MGVHALAVDQAAKNLQDRRSIMDGFLKIKQKLRPGAKIVITDKQVTACMSNAEFGLSNTPYEMEADLEAFLRLENIRKV